MCIGGGVLFLMKATQGGLSSRPLMHPRPPGLAGRLTEWWGSTSPLSDSPPSLKAGIPHRARSVKEHLEPAYNESAAQMDVLIRKRLFRRLYCLYSQEDMKIKWIRNRSGSNQKSVSANRKMLPRTNCLKLAKEMQ